MNLKNDEAEKEVGRSLTDTRQAPDSRSGSRDGDPEPFRPYLLVLVALVLTISIVVLGIGSLHQTRVITTEQRVRVAYGVARYFPGGVWNWPQVSFTSTGQTSDVGELVGSSRVCQTFAAQYSGLSQVEVRLFTYARQNTGPFLFHLRTAPDEPENLVSLTQDASEVEHAMYYAFEFPPISDSAGQVYCFCLEAPEAELHNSITAVGTLEDTYPDGEAVFRSMWGESVGVRDLEFHLGYRPPLPDALSLLWERLDDYKPSALGHWRFYALLGVAYLTLLCLMFARFLPKQQDP